MLSVLAFLHGSNLVNNLKKINNETYVIFQLNSTVFITFTVSNQCVDSIKKFKKIR